MFCHFDFSASVFTNPVQHSIMVTMIEMAIATTTLPAPGSDPDDNDRAQRIFGRLFR
jgi:hypothetical protein